MTPIPEPYDITEIPHIPWVPGLAAWVAITVALALVATMMWRRNSPRATRGDLRVVDKLIADLKATTSARGEMSLERASRIARRLVSHISGQHVMELTGEELRATITEETPPLLKETIEAVASFEELGYAPASTQRDTAARELATRLTTLIEEYRNQMRAR
jgi:hypothetical protein